MDRTVGTRAPDGKAIGAWSGRLTLALGVIAALVLSACSGAPSFLRLPAGGASAEVRAEARRAVDRFVAVVEAVQPVAEAECAAALPGTDCDYLIVVDDRPGQPPNAFQTTNADGRPVIVFNVALIASARNADELAFIMGHEAAHHILGHIDRQMRAAESGAEILGELVALSGAAPEEVDAARRIGAEIVARAYSKELELEADRLGTIIALEAGYDPVLGAQFFSRVPDAPEGFWATHPPSAVRFQLVRETAAELGAS